MRGVRFSWWWGKGSAAFLKKSLAGRETKNFCSGERFRHLGTRKQPVSFGRARLLHAPPGAKVFWFFFSKKNRFFW
jgi:hypothetical protein